MFDLKKMIDHWSIESRIRGKFLALLDSVPIFEEVKVEPYLVAEHQIKPFNERLYDWLQQFTEEEQRYLFFLALKIIFFTSHQISYLMLRIYQRGIKKIILEEIIEEKKQILSSFSYRDALQHYPEELNRTLFVGLTESSLINDFSHQIGEIHRREHLPWDYIDFNSIVISKVMQFEKKGDKGEEENNKEICRQFFENVIRPHRFIKNKTRLIIFEDQSCSGTDFVTCIDVIKSCKGLFKKVILAPYIITYKSLNIINEKIDTVKDDSLSVKITFGTLLPEELKCFDTEKESYLEKEWYGIDPNVDICEKIKDICNKYYRSNFQHVLPERVHKFGYKRLGMCYLNSYNCPNNCLPIIWCSKNWKPLFPRSDR